MGKEGFKKLRLVFGGFLVLYIVNLVAPATGSLTYTQRLWAMCSAVIGLLAIVVLIREGVPCKSTIVIGVILGLLAGLFHPITGVITLLAFLASMRVMESSADKIAVIKRPYSISIVIGLGAGLILGVINLFLSGATLEFAPTLYAFVLSLNPGVSEEVVNRLYMYAFSIYLLGGKIGSRKEEAWVYVLMIILHVLMHFPDTYFVNGSLQLDVGSLLIGPIILGLVFGLPMTLALHKRDLTSAMIIHTVVDWIRFTFVGMPF